MQIAEAFVAIRPQVDQQQFGRDLERQVQRPAQNAARTIAGFFGAAAFGRGLKGMIDQASDLNEAVNVTGLTFDRSRDKIERFVSTSAERLGQSERAARTATASFGGLLQNLGLAEEASADWSITLTQLASDLGSAFNKDPAQAVEAIGSALRGETEPIRAFNIQLDDTTVRQRAVALGFAATAAEVDKAGKAQATLDLIMEQSTRVQGDFANTIDGAANAARVAAAKKEDAAASLGKNFLPVYERIVAVVGDAAEVFGALPGPVQTGVVALVGLVALAGPIRTVADVVGSIGKRASQSAGGVGELARQMGTATAAAGAAAFAWSEWNRISADAKEAAKELGETVEGAFSTVTSLDDLNAKLAETDLAIADLREDKSGSNAPWDADFRRQLGAGIDELERLRGTYGEVADQAEDLARKTGISSDEALTLILRQRELGVAASQNARSFEDFTASLSAGKQIELADAMGLTKDQATQLFGPTNRAAGAVGDLGAKAGASAADIAEMRDKVDGLRDSLTAFFDPLFGAVKAIEANRDALREAADAQTLVAEKQKAFNDAVREHGRKSAEAKTASEELATAQRNLEAANIAAAESALDVSTASLDLAAAVEANRLTVDQAAQTLGEWVRQGLLTQEQADEVAATFGEVAAKAEELQGHRIDIPVRADVDQTSIDRLQLLVDIINQLADAGRTVGLALDDFLPASGGNRGIARRAGGGPVSSGSPYLVGEEGPELFVPRASGAIVPNGQVVPASAAVAGSRRAITINGGIHLALPTLSANPVAEIMREFEVLEMAVG